MSGTEGVKALSQQFVSHGHFLLCFSPEQSGRCCPSVFAVGQRYDTKNSSLALACLAQGTADWVQCQEAFFALRN